MDGYQVLFKIRKGVSEGKNWQGRLFFISISTLNHTLLRYVQELIWGRRVKDTEIEHDPLFIIGHWRSGPTLLHELLTLDERHTYLTTYKPSSGVSPIIRRICV